MQKIFDFLDNYFIQGVMKEDGFYKTSDNLNKDNDKLNDSDGYCEVN